MPWNMPWNDRQQRGMTNPYEGDPRYQHLPGPGYCAPPESSFSRADRRHRNFAQQWGWPTGNQYPNDQQYYQGQYYNGHQYHNASQQQNPSYPQEPPPRYPEPTPRLHTQTQAGPASTQQQNITSDEQRSANPHTNHNTNNVSNDDDDLTRALAASKETFKLEQESRRLDQAWRKQEQSQQQHRSSTANRGTRPQAPAIGSSSLGQQSGDKGTQRAGAQRPGTNNVHFDGVKKGKELVVQNTSVVQKKTSGTTTPAPILKHITFMRGQTARVVLHITTAPQKVITFDASRSLLEQKAKRWLEHSRRGVPNTINGHRISQDEERGPGKLHGFVITSADPAAEDALAWIMHMVHERPAADVPEGMSIATLVNFAGLSDYLGLGAITTWQGTVWAAKLYETALKNGRSIELSTAAYTLCAAAQYEDAQLWDLAKNEIWRYARLDRDGTFRDENGKKLRMPRRSFPFVGKIKRALKEMRNKKQRSMAIPSLPMPHRWSRKKEW